MVDLLLKHAYGLLDEEVVEWGLTVHMRSIFVRRRIFSRNHSWIQVYLEVDGDSRIGRRCVEKSNLKRVTVDTAVQEKVMT